MSLVLGIDVGTSGTKAVVVEPSGEVVASATVDYSFSTPKPLWAEQDPEDWWRAVRSAMQQVIAGRAADIRGIGLSGQMHGLVVLDRQGSVIRPAILWNDQRTEVECSELTQQVGAARVIELTGNPILTGFTAPKIRWLQKHEPDAWSRIATVLLPKDYIRYRLSDELATDVSDASGTSLFDVAGRRWSSEMLEAVSVPRAWVPDAAESPEPVATLSSRLAHSLGLEAGLPIVAGAGDQAAQAVGSGLVEEGLVSASLGTSGTVFAPSQSYRVDPAGRLHAFCHAVPGQWHLMGVMLSAGGSLRWFRDVLGGDQVSYESIVALAAEAPAGCEGLLFLPYLTGERTPHADPNARGAWVGLTVRHGKEHLARSVLEGVTFGLCDSLDLMRDAGVRPQQVRLSGGGARSSLWRQLLADVFATPVVTLAADHGAALGAALLAQVGIGLHADVKAASASAVRLHPREVPGEDRGVLAQARDRFKRLYPALASEFSIR